ncbi:MAG TPA: phosphoethanolamine transferase domain-containing protein, partial [Steroidobacteraceae bacterium]|nr:phosphoethanolamine transferase domain-containing protein [Steroidobacteraceae bacterium]
MSKRVVQSRLWVPPVLSTEALVVLTSIYIVVFGNLPWWQGALAARSWAEAGTWLFAACVGIALAALQYMLLVLIATRRTVKLWLTLVLIATGVTSYYMRSYAALLDPTMMRNVLRTDAREVGDLLSWSLIWQTLAFVLPAAVFVWWAELRIWSWGRAAGQRALTLVAALVLAVLALLAVNRDFTSLMRNERELRYRITPANLIYSTARNLFSDARTSVKPRVLVGNDARVGPRVAAAARPVAFVLVVGETGRAANFSLNGYARQTNPELAKRNVVAFQDVTACGTSTEVSLPCMFSPYGRADYDEELIRRSDGLLQIVARTDIKVLWRENQSGCKGVCDGAGIDARNVDPQLAPALCRGTECLDGILVEELKAALAAPGGSRLIVLHEMGSHGPAYYERYPPRLRRFTPTCDSPELRRCTPEEVVNTYD